MAPRLLLPSTTSWPISGRGNPPTRKQSAPTSGRAGAKRAAQVQEVAPGAQKVRHTPQDTHTIAHTRSLHTHTTTRKRALQMAMLVVGATSAMSQRETHGVATRARAHTAQTLHKSHTIHCTFAHTHTCNHGSSSLVELADVTQGRFWFGAHRSRDAWGVGGHALRH